MRSFDSAAAEYDAARRGLIADIEALLRNSFEGGAMVVPYQTRLWTAQLR
jgi:hypothetical protein